MTPLPPPPPRSRFIPRTVRVVVLGAIAWTGWWGLRPLASPVLPTPDLTAAEAEHATPPPRQLALDTRAFSTPLWVAPPAPPTPPVPPAPPPPPPPLKLQLIAIVREGGSGAGESGDAGILSVMLYDPDADRMLSLKEGDTLEGGRVIEKITSAAVQIKEPPTRDGRAPAVRTLALTDVPAGTGGGR